MLTLTAITASVALFGAVAVADGVDRLFLGGFAIILIVDVAMEIRRPGAIERRQPKFDDQPAGPRLVGMFVFVVLNAIALSLVRERTQDIVVAFLLYGLSFLVTYGLGQLVRWAVLRLPRYRAGASGIQVD
jgi:hypothetical protein